MRPERPAFQASFGCRIILPRPHGLGFNILARRACLKERCSNAVDQGHARPNIRFRLSFQVLKCRLYQKIKHRLKQYQHHYQSAILPLVALRTICTQTI